METLEQTTVTIPTHLSRPRRIIGPFTKNQVLSILLGIGFSAELYFSLAFFNQIGSFGNILRLVIGTLPLSCVVLASLFSFAGRPLGTWAVLLLLYCIREKDSFWCSVCKRDRYAFAPEHEQKTEEKQV